MVRQRRDASPEPGGPPQLNDAGFQTASVRTYGVGRIRFGWERGGLAGPYNFPSTTQQQGFVDGRMSGKWNNILVGLRPNRTGATPSPPLLGAQGALREHEMLQLEKSMAAMGYVCMSLEPEEVCAEACGGWW